MKYLVIVLYSLVLVSCSPVVSEKQRAISEEPEKTERPTVVSETLYANGYRTHRPSKLRIIKVYEKLSFGDVISKEGIPFDNIIPRKKEQIAIFKMDNYYSLYYFKKNELVLKCQYSFSDWDEMKKKNKYPSQIFEDMGV